MDDSAKHHPMLAQFLGESPRIHPGNPRDLVVLQPVPKRAHRSLMAVCLTHLGNNHTPHMDALALKILRETPLVALRARHSVVPDERIGEHENLPPVTGIREALRVPRHPCVENNLPVRINCRTEGFSFEYGSVL